MKILLDTCTFLWIAGEPRQLSARARAAFTAPDHDVYLSAASAWEIAVKQAIGRLPLPEPAAQFVVNRREHHGVESLAIDEESALQAARLPLLHRDPFDRVLVGQAIVHGLTLLTPDPLIAQYPVRVLW